MTTRLDAGGQQQRRGGVAVVVQANLPNARITQQGAPRLVVEVFVERASIRLSEYQIPVLLPRAGRAASSRAGLAPQCRGKDRRCS
jgi:hypothetical protein